MSYKQNIKDNILKTLEQDTVKDQKLTKEMKQSFLDYSMSVIKSRALPDYRDGLKPVHRRIIYAAYQEKLTHEDKYKKSAAIVGSVMGSYHPHGDSAIYDALVRMAQEFSLRYPLIQGQGNFGSIDGDSPAAMRYTEARLSEISSEFLEGVDESWIEDMGMMTDNYDQSKREPVALPTLIPNVLVNGGEGIAVGMATKIPPHNLSEVIDASIALIDNPNLSNEDIFRYIKGPDFPTGGEVMNYRAIKNYFSNSSRGEKSFRIRSKAIIEPLEDDKGNRIVFTEIPYGVKKSQIIKRIAELINPDPKKGKYVKELGDYIDEVRDESSREGIRIVVECDKYCSPEIILNNLYKHTRLQLTYSPNLTVLVDDEPKKLSILEILKLYLVHQQQLLRARLEYKASKLKERIHILDGRLMIIDDIVEAVKIITNSDNPDDELKQRYFLDDIQLKDILSLPIGRLKKLSSEKMRQEREEKLSLLKTTENILADKHLQDEELKKKLTNIKEKYGDDRRTSINMDEFNTGEISVDSLRFYLPSVLVMFKEIKKGGANHLYLNKIPMSLFKERRIDSKKMDQGPKSFGNSYAQDLVFCKGGDDVLFFSKSISPKGESYKVYKKKAYELDLSVGKKDKGSSLLNIDKQLNIETTSIISIPKEDYFGDVNNRFLAFASRKGNLNVVRFNEFVNINSNGKYAYRMRARDFGDEIYKVVRFESDNPERLNGYAVLFTDEGKVAISSMEEFRIKNRNTAGIKAIKLGDSELVGFSAIPKKSSDTSYIFTINKYGKGKLTKFDDYRVTKRDAKGILSQSSPNKLVWWKVVDKFQEISDIITPKLLSEHENKLSKDLIDRVNGFFGKIRNQEITRDVYDALSGKITAKSMADYLRKTEKEIKDDLEAKGIPLSKEKIDQKFKSSEVNRKIKKLYRLFTKNVQDKSFIISGFVVDSEEWDDILIVTKNNRCVRFNVQDMIKQFSRGRNTAGGQILKGIEENDKYDWDVLLRFAVEVNVEGISKPVLAEGHLLRKTYNDRIVSAVKIPTSTQDTE